MPESLYRRYRELQEYVGWTEADARNVHSVAGLLDPHFASLIDDFYSEIDRHPDARKVITGGADQIQRLKGTLRAWLKDLVTGPYDQAYVTRRWRVGWRHVEIGLNQVYTNVALSRLRSGCTLVLLRELHGDPAEFRAILHSFNKLLDLDLAIIEDAYQTEYLARQQRAERLAAIGQVAGGIAHELRNPLNVVKTSVYYLNNARNPAPAKVAEHLKRIDQQVTLADGVITALSNFAKMPIPDQRPFAIAKCIHEALATLTVPGNMQVTLEFPEDLPQVLADEAQVRIVFSNLIRNARDAMPQGGQLTMSGACLADRLEVTVTDTGIGIPPENLKRVMDPLYSTKARGLGLGLAIARAILEKNSGALSVESEVGRGTTFRVRLLAAPR